MPTISDESMTDGIIFGMAPGEITTRMGTSENTIAANFDENTTTLETIAIGKTNAIAAIQPTSLAAQNTTKKPAPEETITVEVSLLESGIAAAPEVLELGRVVKQSHGLREPLYPRVASGTVGHREVDMVKQPRGFWESVKQYVYAILFD